MISVFPVGDYFAGLAATLEPIAFPALILFLIVSVGIHSLQAFENTHLENKVKQFVILIFFIIFWPGILVGIKTLVDAFNTALIQDVFNMNWEEGIGGSVVQNVKQSLHFGLDIPSYPFKIINFAISLLLLAAKQIIYWIFLIFFFFYAALGPLVIASGILADDVGDVFTLFRELIILLLWQSTFVILIGLVQIGAGSSMLFLEAGDNFFKNAALSLALTVLILLVPFITRKFATIVTPGGGTPGFSWGDVLFGVATGGWLLKRATTAPARLFAAATGTASGAKFFQHGLTRAAHLTQEVRARAKGRRLKNEERRLTSSQESFQQRAQYSKEAAMRDRSVLQEEVPTKRDEPEVKGARRQTDKLVEVKVTDETQQFFYDELGLEFEGGKGLVKERGPVESDKYRDMRRLGIEHLLGVSRSDEERTRYQKALNDFNRRYGHLYDSEGRFVGDPEDRPKAPTVGEEDSE